MYNHINN